MKYIELNLKFRQPGRYIRLQSGTEMERRNCYCCCQTQRSPKYSGLHLDILNNNLDSALHELGMLSSVTESRKQYLAEKSHSATDVSRPASSTSVPNSPARGYKVIQLNTQYITGLGSTASISQRKLNYGIEKEITFTSLGTDYEHQDSLSDSKNAQMQIQYSKVSHVKLARINRFRTPYEVPWRLTQTLYNADCSNKRSQTSHDNMHMHTKSLSQNCPVPNEFKSVSSSQLPKKNGLHRSKSLDDLDISKLQIAEKANHNIIKQSREIDSVSQHLKQMSVG